MSTVKVINKRDDILQCHVHRNSFYIEGNLNYISIHHELCLIYNILFGLNFSFNESLNNSYQNLIVENLPFIFYGGYTIKKGFIPNFLKHLVGLDKNEIYSDKLFLLELENIEKVILTDLQLSLNVYNYFNYFEKTNYFWKFFKFIYQPFTSLSTSRKDNQNLIEINKFIGVTSKPEAIDNVRKINEKIENFLIRLGGEKYVENVHLREITSIDLLIYAAYKAQIRILNKHKRKKYKLDSSFFKNFNTLVEGLDNIILNRIKIKNEFKILSPEALKIPKFVFVNKNFKKYLDTPPETKEVKKRTLIRKTIISSFFIGFLILLKFTYKN